MSEIARTGYVIIGRQSGKGGALAGAAFGTYGLQVTSASLSGQSERMDDEPEIGGTRDYVASSALNGGFMVTGDLSGQFRPRVFGLLLMGAGWVPSAPVQDGTTGAYTHTFTPGGTADLTYLTIETRWGSTNAIRRASDCLVNEIGLSVDAGGRATFTASVIGTNEAFQATATVPTYETEPTASWDGSAVTLDGLGTYRFETCSFSMANALSDDEWVIGSRRLDDVTAAGRDLTFTGRIKTGNNTPSVTDLYRAAVYGSKTATTAGGSDPYHSSAAVTFGSTRKVGTSTTVFAGATVTMPDVVLNGFPLEASGDDRLSVEVNGRAYKAAGHLATIDLRNAFATNYATA